MYLFAHRRLEEPEGTATPGRTAIYGVLYVLTLFSMKYLLLLQATRATARPGPARPRPGSTAALGPVQVARERRQALCVS